MKKKRIDARKKEYIKSGIQLIIKKKKKLFILLSLFFLNKK